MSLYLTIDRGNSAAKVAVWHDDAITNRWQCRQLSAAGIAKHVPLSQIGGIIYSSVVDDSFDGINTLIENGIPTIMLSADTPLPLHLRYATPSTLGHDRIAAAVGARHLHHTAPLLVVDIGTAVTYDVVVDRDFIGGNIAPGPWMRLESLNRLTARLPHVDPQGDVTPWGDSTPTAMRNGAILGIVAEIDYYRQQLPADATVVITGGDAHLIAPHLRIPADIQPDLVHIGLKTILTATPCDKTEASYSTI